MRILIVNNSCIFNFNHFHFMFLLFRRALYMVADVNFYVNKAYYYYYCNHFPLSLAHCLALWLLSHWGTKSDG